MGGENLTLGPLPGVRLGSPARAGGWLSPGSHLALPAAPFLAVLSPLSQVSLCFPTQAHHVLGVWADGFPTAVPAQHLRWLYAELRDRGIPAIPPDTPITLLL